MSPRAAEIRPMQIFLYEHTTGGGLLADELDSADSASLVAEGAAMIQALAEDFGALTGVTVVALRDACLAQRVRIAGRVYDVTDAAAERRQFEQLVCQSDWTLI